MEASGQFPLVLKRSQPCQQSDGHPIAIIRVSNPKNFHVEVSADDGAPFFSLGVVPFDCRLPQEPICIAQLRDRSRGIMLHSVGMDVMSDDERVKTGLDAPENKNDCIIMDLNKGVLSFGAQDRNFFFSTRLEDRYAVVVSLAMTDRGAKQLQIRGLGNKRKHEAETRDEMLWSQRKFTDAEIHCGGKQFPVHRAIVAVEGSCFERMFESGGEGTRDGIVVIHDANPTTVQAVLQ